MQKICSLEELSQHLGQRDMFSADIHHDSIENLVDALIELGSTDKVYASHDDHLGLKNGLSEAFLNSNIEGDDTEKFGLEVHDVLEQANIIIEISQRKVSEEEY